MEKIGVILARLQPIHNGHLALINKSLQENDKTYVFIGSADKFNQRNPLPISLRIQLCKETFKESFMWDEENNCCMKEFENVPCKNKLLYLIPLDDLTDESDNSHDWGFYLFSKIVSETHNSNFTIYYSDGFEIITTWFPGFILRNNISLSLLARNATEEGISATKIREYIVENNTEKLKQYVPACVYNYRDTIKQHIELSKLIK